MTLQTPVCPTCGSQNPCGQQFCGTCGARLLGDKPQADKDQQTYSCPECGQAVAQDAKFCGRCGTSLNSPAQENPDNSILTGIDGQKKNKKKNSERMITIALVVAALLVGGGAFIFSVVSQKAQHLNTPLIPEIKEGTIVINHYSYTDNSGSFHVVGELQNVGAHNTELNKVTVTSYDTEGAILVKRSGYGYLQILRPNERCPFEIILPSLEKNYQLDVTWQLTEKEPLRPAVLDLLSRQGENGSFYMSGKVKNTGTQPLVIALAGTFYDKAGQVVAADLTFCYKLPLEPGDASKFNIVIDTETASNISTYRVLSEGYQ